MVWSTQGIVGSSTFLLLKHKLDIHDSTQGSLSQMKASYNLKLSRLTLLETSIHDADEEYVILTDLIDRESSDLALTLNDHESRLARGFAHLASLRETAERRMDALISALSRTFTQF